MAIEQLTEEEQTVVLGCLRAASAYIDDREKHARLGVDQQVLQGMIERWPAVADRDQNGTEFLAINNCLNEVCNGFRIEPVDWSSWFNLPMEQIQAIYRKWLALQGSCGGIR